MTRDHVQAGCRTDMSIGLHTLISVNRLDIWVKILATLHCYLHLFPPHSGIHRSHGTLLSQLLLGCTSRKHMNAESQVGGPDSEQHVDSC